MTRKEIEVYRIDIAPDINLYDCAVMLQEIAYQLAVLNERADTEKQERKRIWERAKKTANGMSDGEEQEQETP
jgi:hypothetical protein